MNIFIYNVHKDPEFKNALKKAFIDKEPVSGLNRSVECEVIAQMGGYLFVNVSATDNEVVIKALNSFKTRFHIYFKVVNFGVELKFINITKDFKFSSVKVTDETVADIKDSMESNSFDKPTTSAKKIKYRKTTWEEVLGGIDSNTKLDIEHDGVHVRSLGKLNDEKIMIVIPENSSIHIDGGKFTTNNDEIRNALIAKGLVENA